MNQKSMHRVGKVATLSTVIAALAVAAGCAADPREPSTAMQATPETDFVPNTTKTPEPNTTKTPEPIEPEAKPAVLSHPVVPAAALIKWFDEHGNRGSSRAMFRIPVVIVLGGLGIERTFVGTGLDGSFEPLEVKLDDSALGISLHDRIRQIKNNGSVAVWIEGQWGPLLRPGMPVTHSDKHTIAVRKVGEPIESAEINAQVTLIN